ncbi:MAG TPA: RAD55 family ATPase, partial [Candidatus Hodarchaeales archaeon]|nr:RAD55 family ATPase [Candidatus Hodarchaeales archaeon]
MSFTTASADGKPKIAHRLTKIGIPTLDERLKGLPTNSVILLLGDPGSGFDTFLHQILFQRSSRGAKTLYVSLDRPKSEIYYDMATYNWSPDSWDIIDLSPAASRESGSAMSWTMDSVNLLQHDLIRRIEEAKARVAKETLRGEVAMDTTINSLTSLLLNSELQSVLSFVNEYAAAIRDTNGFHFLTVIRGVHEPRVETVLQHLADVVIEITSVQSGNE